MPRVSVIITTHNRPRLLKGAIQSVLNQDFNDFELIVINDASVGSETDDVVKSFSDPRIRYVKNNTNLGSTASLNIGLKEARGEYIAILDDDDEWINKEKLTRQVMFLDTRPEYVAVGTDVIVVDEMSGKEVTRSQHGKENEDLSSLLSEGNPIAHSSVMYRREAALAVGGYTSHLPRGKDYELWFKISMRGKLAVLPFYGVKYREASMQKRNVVMLRYQDARATAQVLWMHRKIIHGFFLQYAKVFIRVCVFWILLWVPEMYRLYKKQ